MKRLGSLTFLMIAFLWSPLLFVASRGLNFSAIQALWSRTDILEAVGRSLFLGTVAATASTLAGTLTAFALPALPPLQKRLLRAGLIFPMVLPEIAMALSFLVWFIRLGWPLGWGTLISSHIAFTFSYATLVMKTRVEVLDYRLVEAARDLGANRWHVLRHAYWPQLAPGVLASWITCFGLSLDDFLISFFVKGLEEVTLPIQIYSMLRLKIGNEIYALSLILFCISLTVALLSQIWLGWKKNSAAPLFSKT